MEMNRKNMKNILILAVAIVLVYQISDNLTSVTEFLGYAVQIIFPFLLGLGIAFIINVPLRSIERKMISLCKNSKSFLYKKKRVISFLVTVIFVIGVLVLISFLVIPQLTETIKEVFKQIPQFYETVAAWLKTIPTEIPQVKEIVDNLEHSWDVVGAALSKITSNQIAGMFNSTVGIISGVVSSVTTFIIAIVFACYVLFQKERLGRQCKKMLYAFLPEKRADRIVELNRLADRTFSNFLAGQCIEAVILGSMFIVSMAIIGLPYNVMIGVLIGVTALIPIVGAFIGCFVGAFLILMVNPMQAVVFVILFFVLQQIEGNVIYPKVVGNSVGLPAIWVLFAVTVGGNLMGVAGMIIGIPIVSMVYTLLSEYVRVRLKEKKVDDSKWENRRDLQPKEERDNHKKSGENAIDSNENGGNASE